MNTYISFNPNYVLKPDDGRALIMSALVGRQSYAYMDDSTSTFIHPIFAIILCFFNGERKEQCIENAALYLHVSTEKIDNFCNELTDNANFVYIKSRYGISTFPPYTLVSKTYYEKSSFYDPHWFHFQNIDLILKRHLTPSTITLMINNVCITNCIYCYEYKEKVCNCKIPLERILELIRESRKLHVRTFDVIGGEFFLYKHWREVLRVLRENSYDPYLSTKMPLKEDDVSILSDLKIRDIQVSIDSMIEEHLKPSIKINDGYVSKMKSTLQLLNKYRIPTMIHTVVSKFTQTTEDMESIYKFIESLDNIVEWKIVRAENSIQAKSRYDTFKTDTNALKVVNDYIESLKTESRLKIVNPLFSKSPSEKQGVEEFLNRSFCSGNYSSIYILPTGDVTICEQLYWEKRFILGNVIRNNIEDIWNSEKAKSLYYLRQKDIPNDSQCHTCKSFNRCRSVKQVCYRDIIREYGSEKWYFPDVRCPYVQY